MARMKPTSVSLAKRFGRALEVFSRKTTEWTGSSVAFAVALGVVLVWLITGPFFHYSDTWQLVINTGTTIVTFLMVFLIQRSQNKDSIAVHIKLNEIVAVLEGASNRLIAVESLSEEEIKTISAHFQRLAEMAKCEESLSKSHSIEEAESRHERKIRLHGQASTPRTPKKKADA
jgi:low affinity Fe/Cu permease